MSEHPWTRELLAQVQALDARIRALAWGDEPIEVDVRLYLSRGKAARKPEITVR